MNETKVWWLHTALVERYWFKWPFEVMRQCGPAVQTLGAILQFTNKSTFASAESIAEKARLPLATVRKHLLTLDEAGWIRNDGRGRTRSNRPRRTCTIAVTKRTLDASKEDYGVAPWWYSERTIKLKWADRAVLSVFMSNLMALIKAAQEIAENAGDSAGNWFDVLTEFDRNRYLMPLNFLEERTGLSRHSVIAAKGRLHRSGILTNFTRAASKGKCPHKPSFLAPNWAFRIDMQSLDNGRCRVTVNPNKDSDYWGKEP